MVHRIKTKLNRRDFIAGSAVAAAGLTIGLNTKSAFASKAISNAIGKRVIVIGMDGMDPVLSERMMQAGQLPNFAKLAEQGGYRRLGTSIPPQSPVAWSNFINGAGPGSHGIFDFIHRNPAQQCAPFYSAAETIAGKTVLRRAGVPFWNYLDKSKIDSTFYNLPANYPASESKYGYHRCLSGMGTPDLMGTYGTYQHYSEDGPVRTKDVGGGRQSMLFFENECAKGQLVGPTNTLLAKPEPVTISFEVHRDIKANSGLINIQGKRIMLKAGQWSDWVKLNFELPMPWFMPNKNISGICRFYLQEVSPNFRLYVSAINTDPSKPYLQITEPAEFIEEISDKLGLFYTTGFQEDHKALSTKVFSDAEYATQAGMVLDERMALLNYAYDNYNDGLLFFYFSSTDLQSHMFWWDSEDAHPVRGKGEAVECFSHLKGVYKKMDDVLGDVLKRYGDKALIMVLSDHGFCNFKRQFNLNSWLRENGYVNSPKSTSILYDVDWSATSAYGLGINGLYINQRGRERDGIVNPGQEREELVEKLIKELEAVTDKNGRRVIHKVHRSDKEYSGSATEFAPDLVIGYSRDYRASWATCLGDMTDEVLLDNDSAWSADHCADVSQVPGVLFCNRPVGKENCALIDMAPTILNEFGLKASSDMTGKNIFEV